MLQETSKPSNTTEARDNTVQCYGTESFRTKATKHTIKIKEKEEKRMARSYLNPYLLQH